MKVEINYPEVPHNYKMCLNRKCSKADTCLRQLVEQSIPEDIESWNIVSPKRLATLKGTCPYYRSAAKVRYGKGFIKILENLPHKQMQAATAHLTTYFGRRTYYRVRKGERLLSPSEQKATLNIIKSYGSLPHQEFDSYVDDYDW